MPNFRFLACFGAACLGLTPPAGAAPTQFEDSCARLASSHAADTERLRDLFKLDWENSLHEHPEFATEVGYPGLNGRWTDQSLEAIATRKRELRAPLPVLRSIDRAKLSPADQLNYDLFQRNVEEAVEGSRFPAEYLQLDQLSGVQQEVARVLQLAPHARVKDYEDMLSRMNGVGTLVDQTITLLRQGLKVGVTTPRVTLTDVPNQIRSQMEADPDQNPSYAPFKDFPASFSPAERQRLQAAAAQALKDTVIPAFGRLLEFVTNSYLPGARQSIALSALPDGQAWYAYNVRAATTTSLTPAEIHELGLAEVKRIRGEMDAVIARTGFKGSFADFSKFLRSDPRFFYPDGASLLRGYRDIAKRVDPELAHLFGKLPRLPYGVKEIPAAAAKSQTTAYYEEGSPVAGRPGWFMANIYAPETRPKWEMTPLTLHEAVPGHHLQISLAQELDNVPEFRKYAGYTAFVEGWGLYAEGLGEDMGFYKDPYEKYGQLTYEMWRAIRLVLDTGIHSLGWTRQQALDYFLANSSKTEHDITVEVDRYIVMPGQATAYKTGELKFKELRQYAAKELGEKFDLRQFHDQVLDSGALPLDVLERRLKAWVSAKAK